MAEPEDGPGDGGALIAGRYRLIEQVGRGGMGTVWRSKDEVLGRTVAVKQLTGHIGVSATLADEAVQRAMREARIAARLHHPNVIGIYDVVEEDDRPYLVMEFLKSRSLSDILVDEPTLPTLPIRELARVGALVAGALTAAHEAGIVHRDVKPGNVLLAADGTVKLTDFGIARAVGDKTVTAAGALVGTVAYMAPETGLGQVADQRSDVYSLGATLYTAIEGEPPSGYDENPIALLYRIVHEDITPPRRAGELAPVLAWMLKRDPIHRLTMRQAQRALQQIADAADATDAVETAAAAAGPVAALPVPDQAAEPAAPQQEAAQAQAAETPEAPQAEPGTPSDAAEPKDATPEPVSGLESESDSEPGSGSAAAAEPEPASGRRPSAVAAALGDRRRQVLIGAVAAAVVAMIVVIALLTTDQGGGGNAGATGAQTPASRSAAASRSPTPARSPTAAAPAPTGGSGPASSSPSPSPSPQDTAQQLSSTITDYYAMMPGNLSTAWNWMTASYQENTAKGYSGYTSFWGNIASVTATDVSAQPPDSVTATITYHEKDGSVITEVTEFGLVLQDGQWKINTSSVISG